MPIPFLDLKRQFSELETELNAAFKQSLERGVYVLGSEVEAFEKEWANFCGAPKCASVASGTDALTLALMTSGAVRPNDGNEVITSTLTAAYTALSIANAGGVPVFADIDPQTYTLDPSAIEKALTPRTRAIVPVHLYGRTANMKAICEIATRHNLIVIEDAAQAHGLSFPNIASAACSRAAIFSFYPTKNLGAYGDGGAVVSNDSSMIKQVKILRQGGHEQALQGSIAGLNSRLDELQAAVLRVKLKHLAAWNDERRRLAQIYDEGLKDSPLLRLPSVDETESHVFHLYVIQHPERDRLRQHLLERGIETLIHYPTLLHQQPLFRRAEQAALPVAESIVNKILSLPLYPQLKDEEAARIIEAILEFDGAA